MAELPIEEGYTGEKVTRDVSDIDEEVRIQARGGSSGVSADSSGGLKAVGARGKGATIDCVVDLSPYSEIEIWVGATGDTGDFDESFVWGYRNGGANDSYNFGGHGGGSTAVAADGSIIIHVGGGGGGGATSDNGGLESALAGHGGGGGGKGGDAGGDEGPNEVIADGTDGENGSYGGDGGDAFAQDGTFTADDGEDGTAYYDDNVVGTVYSTGSELESNGRVLIESNGFDITVDDKKVVEITVDGQSVGSVSIDGIEV